MIATVAIDLFARSIRERLFPPGPSESRRVGLEVEMLPLLTDSGAPCPLEAQDGDVRSTLRLVRAFGISRGWREYRSSKGAPHFVMPNGWSLTFEPGGQLDSVVPVVVLGDPAFDLGSVARRVCQCHASLKATAPPRPK